MTEILLCNLEDIPDGDARGFDPFKQGYHSIFVIRMNERVVAYQNSCPHIPEQTLEWKKNAFLTHDKAHIFCSGHGALFELDTGLCIRGACLGQKMTKAEVSVHEKHVFLNHKDNS